MAAACVRATAHGTRGLRNQPAIDLVLAIDLAILGRDDLRFLEFEYAVAEEYTGVWWLSYVIARGRFLGALLVSSAIYRTAHFHQLYEQRARAHLTRLLTSPRYRPHRWVSRLRRVRRVP